MKTNSPTMPKMLCVAGFIFEDLGLVFLLVDRRHAREDSRAHVTEVRLDERTCLSFLSHTMQSCCRHLRILKVLTLSHQLQDTDVMGLSKCGWILSIYAVKVSAVKTYSKHIFDTLIFFHRTVSSSARHGRISICACVGVREHMCLCVHVQWLTPLLNVR